MRVLIVDDSEALVERLQLKLAEVNGIEVVGKAGNVADAKAEIRKVQPDVVILDIQMPGGNGINVLKELSKSELRPVVVVLSNCCHQLYRRECLKRGARFYLDKSNDFHKVADVLRGLIEAEAV